MPRFIEEQDLETAVCSIVNQSEKSIRAIAVRWAFTGQSGKFSHFVMTQEALFKTARPITPSQTSDIEGSGRFWNPKEPDPLAKIDVSIDYILFTDGTVAGLDVEKASRMISARLVGIHQAKVTLLDIYKEKGLQALLDELNSEPAR